AQLEFVRCRTEALPRAESPSPLFPPGSVGRPPAPPRRSTVQGPFPGWQGDVTAATLEEAPRIALLAPSIALNGQIPRPFPGRRHALGFEHVSDARREVRRIGVRD